MAKKDFPILDSSLSVEKCIKVMNNKHEACIVLHEGFLYSILSYDDLLRESLRNKGKDKQLKNINSSQNFVIVKPDTDVLDIINIMRRKLIDFIVVKYRDEIGLITKNEIVEVNELLFRDIEREELEVLNIY